MPRKISRRALLKTGAVVAASTVLAGCEQYKRYVTLEPYVTPPEDQLAGIPTYYASACRLCAAGCGIVVRVMNGRAVKIEGNPGHPLNRGKLCPRGQAGLQLLYNPDRLSGPRFQAKRETGAQGDMPWDQALDQFARQLQSAGSNVAIWLGPATSGHLVDLFTRFAKAIGAPPPLIYAPGSDGVQALAAAGRRVFGLDAQPAYLIGQSDVVLSFAADFLGVEQSPTRYGIEYGSFRTQPHGLRGRLVQFEARQSMTAAKADDWFPVRPGAEGLVAQAIARLIADQSLGNAERVQRARALAAGVNVDEVVQASGISAADLQRIARLFAEAQHPVAIPGLRLAESPTGADAVAAVQTLNLLAGVVGQPGGLLLDAALPSPAPLHVVPAAYADAQKLLDSMRGGAVKLLIVYGANLAHELPAKAGFVEALANVPFVVSFSVLPDEMAAQSNLVMPDRTYLESWGYTVVSPNFGLPVVTGQQPVVTPVSEARAAGDLLLATAKKIPAAAAALPWPDEVAFIRETIGQLPAGAAGGAGADLLWSRFQQHGGWWHASAPAPAAITPASAALPPITIPQSQGSAAEFPYLLQVYPSVLLGRGEGAAMPWLQGSPDPMTTISWQTWVELHPDTARKLGLTYGDIVRVTSPDGSIEAPVYIYPVIRPDTVGIPLGQGHLQAGRYAANRGANAMHLLGPAPDGWEMTRVRLEATGQKVHQSAFEWTPGAYEDFPY